MLLNLSTPTIHILELRSMSSYLYNTVFKHYYSCFFLSSTFFKTHAFQLDHLLPFLVTVSKSLLQLFNKAKAPGQQAYCLSQALLSSFYIHVDELFNTPVSHFLDIKCIPSTLYFSQLYNHIPGQSFRNIPPPIPSSFFTITSSLLIHLFFLLLFFKVIGTSNS